MSNSILRKFSNFMSQDSPMGHLNSVPENCPVCQYQVAPLYILEYSMDNLNKRIVCCCPREDCAEIYIASYSTPFAHSGYSLVSVSPVCQEKKEFPEEIFELSPRFTIIYNQALNAENFQLDEICGPGYRKSLEFLIKDYAIKLYPDQEEAIKKKFLKNCIVDYINHPKISFLAEKAAWLGNDETHYVRKWADKDVNDLKILINLTVNYIEMELMTELLEKEMAKGK